MSTAIGRAALVLTTNAAGMRVGLDRAHREAASWAAQVGSTINGKLVAAAYGAVAGVLGVTKAVQTLDEVARGGAAAKAFGLTAEQFTGMAGLARSVGEEQREFIESLVTLGKVAEEGAAGKGEVAAAWFKALNVNAGDFAKLNLEEKFFTVFEAIARIPEPASRVRALMVAFGEDGGKYLLPLLAKAPAELRELAKGFAITGDEVERATAANAQINQANAAMSRSWRGIVVALAPVFEAFGQLFPLVIDGIGQVLREIGEWIGGVLGLQNQTWGAKEVMLVALSAVGTAGAIMWDTLSAGAGAFAVGLGLVISGLSYVTDAFAWLVRQADRLPASLKPSWLHEFAVGVTEFSGRVEAAGRGLREWGATAVLGFGTTAARFQDWFRGVVDKTRDGTKKAAAEAVAAVATVRAALKSFDNAALVRGTTAEVSARLRLDVGGRTAQDRMLAEQKRQTAELVKIGVATGKLAARPVLGLGSL